ncbi:MAG: oxidoreductase [bacterium]|nr:MAG: oxidoreductase [bacterium]
MCMYKIAVIGCGRIGSLLEDDPLRPKPASHAGAFARHPKTVITSACDIDGERLKKFGRRWNVPPGSLYSDYRELLKREQPDIVSIAAWTELHCPIVLKAASTKSVKGVYCEKPIARDLREAGKMVSICKRRNIKLIVGHERRFDANFVKVKKMVHKKLYGPLKTIVAHALSAPPPKLPADKYVGGALFHDGTHLMDLILYYGGPAKWVVGFDERPNGKKFIESTAFGLIRLGNGVNVFVEASGERDYFKFDVDLQFQNGRIRIGNSGIHAGRSGKSGRYTGFRELNPAPFKPLKKRTNGFLGGVSELVRAVETGEPPLSNGAEARNALELILALYKSARAGGRKIYIPIPTQNGN